jgi:DNA-binding MarR family transcriptional regulator
MAEDSDVHGFARPPGGWYQVVWRPNKILKPGPLSGLLGYRLRVAQQAVFRDYARAVPEASPGRAGILFLIEANPGVTQSRLAQEVGLDRSTMVGVLHALQARGLVERRRGQDRRTNGLWLTQPGRALAASLKRRIRVHERRVAARLSVAERAQLLRLLEKLAR